MSHPFISIIIPTKDNAKDLMDCLSSIWRLDYPLNKLEIIIWDNNSRQESKNKIKYFLADMTKEKYVAASFIEHNDNYGVYTSRNELCKRVGSDAQFILSIDDDAVLPSQFFERLLPVFQDVSPVGIIGPRTVFDDDPTQTAHGAGFVNWWIGRYSDVDASKVMECDYVIGCCMLIRREVIDSIGGFDRDYYTSHGEVDFCLKAKKKGYKIIYCPDVDVRHRVARGGTQTTERMYYLYRNKLFVIKKNAPIPQKWISLFLYSFFWLPKAIIDSFRRNRRIDLQEILVISRAMTDGWLNRGGRRF